MKKNSIVICGPTATGKTSLAAEIAYNTGSEIISADSRQVYRHMDIGTGKDLDEYTINRTRIPFHLIDITNPSNIYTLYHYQQDFYTTFSKISSEGKIPVISGGTGLYIEAIIKGYSLSDVGEHPDFREEMMKKEKTSLISLLKSKVSEDEFRNTDTSSKKRVVRALEIAEFRGSGSGKEPSRDTNGIERPEINPLIIALYYNREILKKRIEKRVYTRLSKGMVEEVSNLLDSGITRERMIMLGLEYRYITMYLNREMGYNEMVRTLVKEIQRFAKRQMTYFRGMERRGLRLHWIRGDNKAEALRLISPFIPPTRS